MAQPEVIYILMSTEIPYFSHYNTKFQLQIHYTLEGTVENVQAIVYVST